jgi:Cu/Ag efflux protein CusF
MKYVFAIAVIIVLSGSRCEAQLKSQDSTKLRQSETEGKSYKVRATVKHIYHDENKITLKHEKIKGYMPAMTMTFPVHKPSLLDGLEEGSKGIFTIFVFKGYPTVTGVKLSSAKKTSPVKK